jgi:two-component system nitrogen regulation response regulator GlnG
VARILVVDDCPSSLQIVRSALDHDGEVLSAAGAREALDVLAREHVDAVVLDIGLPDEAGLATFERIRTFDATIPVLLVTTTDGSVTAFEATRRGALDYLLKPLDPERVRELVAQAMRIRRFRHVPVRLGQVEVLDVAAADLLIGRSPGMQAVYKAIGRVAQQNVHALIRGESGTGKELVARALYQHGPRSTQSFLAVNCAAIPETLLESELFGHETGAFAGATARRIGKFEQCGGGTLFLDEVGEMTPLMQSKVLRVLQDNRFERVGGNETIESDVWIVAATNRDLEAMVANGQFRADLYYRLNGFPVSLPPLRERVSDIPLLVEHFLARFAKELGKPVCEVARETMDMLARYSWPGNVRELQSSLKQAIIQTTGAVILPEFLPAALRGATTRPSAASAAHGALRSPLDDFIAARIHAGTQTLHADLISYVERILVDRVLRHTEGNLSRAAHLLGITRGSLRNKIRAYGIRISQSVIVDGHPGETEQDVCAAQR